MNTRAKLLKLGIRLGVSLIFLGVPVKESLALPPPEDIPEEILRTEIITEARSSIDGKPLTAAEYAELETKLAESPYPPEIDPQIRQLLFLLRIRKLFQTIIPF